MKRVDVEQCGPEAGAATVSGLRDQPLPGCPWCPNDRSSWQGGGWIHGSPGFWCAAKPPSLP